MNNDITLPEPAFKLRWHDDAARYTVSVPNIGDTDCYTADQVRGAVEADRQVRMPSDEELLKVCESAGFLFHYDKYVPGSGYGLQAKVYTLENFRALLSRYSSGQPKPSNSTELERSAASAEPVMRIYAEGTMRSVTEWLDGARDLTDGDHTLYAAPVAAQPDPNVCYGDGFYDGYWKGRGEGWDAALAAQNPDDAQDAPVQAAPHLQSANCEQDASQSRFTWPPGPTLKDLTREMTADDIAKDAKEALDAERYRWLRKRWARLDENYVDGGPKITSLRVLTDQEVQDGYGWDVDPLSLDRAIDAAMQRTSGSE